MAAISVVVPVFHVQEYIDQCLCSVVEQTFADIEIICVDDRGQDQSMAVVERYARRDPRFTIISHPANLGIAEARNTGLRAASGKYVLFIDSDDWIMPQTLERCFAALEDTGLDSVWFKWLNYLQDGRRLVVDANLAYNHMPAGSITLKTDKLQYYPTVSWNKLYRTSFLRDNRLNWPRGLQYEDNEFFFKCFSLCTRVAVLDEFLYIYRRHANSIMDRTGKGDGKWRSMPAIARNCLEFLDAHGMADHKPALLDFMGKQMRSFVYCRHYKEAIITETKAMLNDFNFDESYRTCKRYGFFTAIQKYRRRRWLPDLTRFAPLINKRITHTGLRDWFLVNTVHNDFVEDQSELRYIDWILGGKNSSMIFSVLEGTKMERRAAGISVA